MRLWSLHDDCRRLEGGCWKSAEDDGRPRFLEFRKLGSGPISDDRLPRRLWDFPLGGLFFLSHSRSSLKNEAPGDGDLSPEFGL